jgi:glycosyltransferase involved in cell wall biosynthesis
MIKVTYIVSYIDQAPIFENTFRLIDKTRFEVSVILLNPGGSQLEDVMLADNIYCKTIIYRGKKDYAKAIYKCFSLLRKLKPDIVHAHLIDAGLIGLLAAYLAGIKNRLYTRHGGSQKVFLKKGVKHDKAINFLATHTIATCENVKEIQVEEGHVPPEKITIINLAFDYDRLTNPDPYWIEQLKQKYNPHNRGPVVGVISRWVEWKGLQYILPAFKEFLVSHPNALLIMANASGVYAPELEKQMKTFKPEEITLIRFEKKFYELYQLFDFFVHVPVGKRFEAFGQIYVEALAAGIPSVFTLAGIGAEIIKDDYNAIVVDFKNSAQITEALNKLAADPCLQEKLSQNGKASVLGKFDFSRHVHEHEVLYTKLYEKKKG